MWRWLAAWLVVFSCGARAEAGVPICYGYGCLVQVTIHYTDGQLGQVRRLLYSAVDAKNERKMISEAIGRMYRWGGEQSDIHNDRGGNFADDNVAGKMDCIDHSTSTTRLLQLLEARGYLRWHRVLATDVRYFAGIFPAHWSAVVEETGGDSPGRFVVDSWFVDNGQPAVILPLEEWKKGAGPDV